MTTWVEGVTTLGPTNLNKLELGVQATAVVADAAIPNPVSKSTSNGLVYNGSTWVAQSIANAQIDAAAAISISKLADPGSGNVITSAGSGAVASKPPGYQFDYVEFTAPVTISATTEGTANTIVTSSSVTYDGSTAVWITFEAQDVEAPANAAGNAVQILLYKDGSSIGFLATVGSSSSADVQVPTRLSRKMIPASGAHTFSVRAFRTNANGTVNAGAGGAGAYMPGYIRITKAA